MGFPSTELRAKGYAMPSPKSVLVSGAQTGVTEVDIVIPWFDPELSLNSFLEGRILGLDGLPIVFDPQYQGSTPLITITSATGLFAWTYADMEGKFVFDEIPSGQDWYVGGSFFDLATGKDLSTLKDSGPYLSGDYEIMIQLEDFSGANPMPEKQTRIFDRRKNFQVSLSDGMEVLIPAGAIPINDETPMAQITVAPQSERLHRDLSRVPVGYGYDIVVTDMKGQSIQGPFLKEVKMTIPLNPFFLDAMDMDVNDVVASSYDHKFNSWVSPNAMVVASEQNKIHVMTDHFSTWAPTARAETHVPMPVPLGVSSHATSNVNWYEHEWFGVFYSRPDDEWIFHTTHGLLYVDQQSSTDDGIWFWDDTFEAWLWVKKESYRAGESHFFYHAGWESWIWHIADSLNPRTFYDYDRAGWFTDEMAFSVYLTSTNNSFGTVSGSGMYDKGEMVQFSAKPNYGYAFSGWSGDLSSSESTIEIPSVDRVSNLHANFYKIPESLLSIDFTGSGSGEVKGSGNYEYGETATLRAEAGYSSVFFGWWENGSKISWNEEIELLMEGNRKIEAQFEPATIENILKAKYASNP